MLNPETAPKIPSGTTMAVCFILSRQRKDLFFSMMIWRNPGLEIGFMDQSGEAITGNGADPGGKAMIHIMPTQVWLSGEQILATTIPQTVLTGYTAMAVHSM